MPDVDPNPYAPPAQESRSNAIATRWRVISAAISFSLGFISFAIGVIAMVFMVRLAMTEDALEAVGLMLAGCVLYLGFGAAWTIAGWWYWRRRYWRALIANGVGILIPVVLFAVLGV